MSVPASSTNPICAAVFHLDLQSRFYCIPIEILSRAFTYGNRVVMDSAEPEQTPFAVVSAQTSKFLRVRKLGISRIFEPLHVSNADLDQLQQYQNILDKSTPFVPQRWLGTGALLIIFFLRIFLAQGWYIGMAVLDFA